MALVKFVSFCVCSPEVPTPTCSQARVEPLSEHTEAAAESVCGSLAPGHSSRPLGVLPRFALPCGSLRDGGRARGSECSSGTVTTLGDTHPAMLCCRTQGSLQRPPLASLVSFCSFDLTSQVLYMAVPCPASCSIP